MLVHAVAANILDNHQFRYSAQRDKLPKKGILLLLAIYLAYTMVLEPDLKQHPG